MSQKENSHLKTATPNQISDGSPIPLARTVQTKAPAGRVKLPKEAYMQTTDAKKVKSPNPFDFRQDEVNMFTDRSGISDLVMKEHTNRSLEKVANPVERPSVTDAHPPILEQPAKSSEKPKVKKAEP